MSAIHLTKENEQKIIELNEHYQPIGPNDEAVAEFRIFLGSVVRKFAPLSYSDWRKVPATTKDQMWESVKKAYVIREEGKKFVMTTFRNSIRTFKSRIKSDFYSRYLNDEERLQHRPSYIPEEDFKKLLEYWNDINVQKRADANKKHRKHYKDVHTTGPKGFASIYHKLQKEKGDGLPLSKSEMYIATRKRKFRQVYRQSDEEVRSRINGIEQVHSMVDIGQVADGILANADEERGGQVRFLGRDVTKTVLKRRVQPCQFPVDVDSEYAKAIRKSIEKEMKGKFNADMEEWKNQYEETIRKRLEQMFSAAFNRLSQVNSDMLKDNMDMLKNIFGLSSSGEASSAHLRNDSSVDTNIQEGGISPLSDGIHDQDR